MDSHKDRLESGLFILAQVVRCSLTVLMNLELCVCNETQIRADVDEGFLSSSSQTELLS